MWFGQTVLLGSAARRLLAASLLGAAVGAQREMRHKSSGLRTNMLLCLGSALFTLMSLALAGAATTDKTRIASNIVQGVGFLGAGLILHHRYRVQGLTTAASVFVVAAIGMACGGGFYLEAAVATMIVLISLWGIGWLEFYAGWQRYLMLYEVRADVGMDDGRAQTSDAARRRMYRAVLKVLDGEGVRLETEEQTNVAGLERLCFPVLATRRVHQRLLGELRASDETDEVIVFRDVEDE